MAPVPQCSRASKNKVCNANNYDAERYGYLPVGLTVLCSSPHIFGQASQANEEIQNQQAFEDIHSYLSELPAGVRRVLGTGKNASSARVRF